MKRFLGFVGVLGLREVEKMFMKRLLFEDLMARLFLLPNKFISFGGLTCKP